MVTSACFNSFAKRCALELIRLSRVRRSNRRAGLYCGADKTCTPDGTAGSNSCGDGKACTDNGRCVQAFDGGLFDAGTADGSGSEACADVSVTLARIVPTVILLIDQSGSMTTAFGSTSRWKAIRSTLMDPSTGIVEQLQDDMRIGLTLYTSHGGSAGGTCPELTTVPPGLHNYDAINAVYAPATPQQDTPTGDSLSVMAADLEKLNVEGDKIIVLATDGEPDSCADPNGGGAPLAVSAAKAAFANGIRTYIIGVGDAVAASHLQDMANAGVGAPSGGSAPFWQAFDAQGLVNAFQAIITAPKSCVFALNGQVVAGMEPQGDVELDGTALGYNDPNGWKLDSPSELELLGSACDAIQEGDHQLSASFPCDAVVVPN